MASLAGLKEKFGSLGRSGSASALLKMASEKASSRGGAGKQSLISVDFGASSLRAMQFTNGELSSVAAATLDDTFNTDETLMRLEAQAEQVREWVKSGLFRGKRVSCVLPTEALVVKHLQVEAIEGLDVSTAARMSAADILKTPAEKLVHRCIEVCPIRSGGMARTEVVSLSAHRTAVERMVRMMRRMGLDLVGVHAEPLALREVFGQACEDSTMLVELGSRQTSSVILDEGRVSVVRFAPLGMDAIDHTLASSLNVSLVKARRARERSGGLAASGVASCLEATMSAGLSDLSGAPVATVQPKPGVDQAVLEVIEELSEELMVAVRYHRGLFPSKRVSRVVFTGGGARCLEVCKRVAERLGLPAQLGDPLAAVPRAAGVQSVGVDLSEPTPAFSALLGAHSCPVDL